MIRKFLSPISEDSYTIWEVLVYIISIGSKLSGSQTWLPITAIIITEQ